jgi:hypothetical protein
MAVVSPSGLPNMGDTPDNRSTQVNSCSSAGLSKFSFEADDSHSTSTTPGRQEIPFDPGKHVSVSTVEDNGPDFEITVSTGVELPVAPTKLSTRWIGKAQMTPRIRSTGLTRRNGGAQSCSPCLPYFLPCHRQWSFLPWIRLTRPSKLARV